MFTTRRLLLSGSAAIVAGLSLMMLTPPSAAADPGHSSHSTSSVQKPARNHDASPSASTTSEEKADDEKELSTIDVLAGLRSGQLSGSAEGTGDGRMTLSLKNRTDRKLRVVLPPGLIVSGATGQFGGGMG